jgi:hypothetical protein
MVGVKLAAVRHSEIVEEFGSAKKESAAASSK